MSNDRENIEPNLDAIRRDFVEVHRENAALRAELADIKGILLQLQGAVLDLTPIIVIEVETDYGALQFDEPLSIPVSVSDCGTLLCAIDQELTIDAFARTRSDLIREVFAQIRLLWVEYAKTDDALLTPSALTLKTILLRRIKELVDVR